MNCLMWCCLCIPLEPACYIIGFFYIIIHSIWLEGNIEMYLNYQKMEEKYRDIVWQIMTVFRIVLGFFEILLGILIIISTCKRSPTWLKGSACGVGIAAVLNFVSQLSEPVLGRPLAPFVLTMMLFLYLAIVVFSYGQVLEEERYGTGDLCVVASPPPPTPPPPPPPPQQQDPSYPWHQEPFQRPQAADLQTVLTTK